MMTMQRRVRIIADSDPESPREWENVGTMVCWHRRYNLGDQQPSESAGEYMQSLAIGECERLAELIEYWENDGYEWLRELGDSHDQAYRNSGEHIRSLIQHVLDQKFIILPLYLYDHSGITMSTGRFSCPWDSGQVGFIYCTIERGISECGSVENAEKCLRGEVEAYDQYLTGDVYGYVIEEADDYGLGEDDDLDWSEVDSCWGFYGSDPFENGMSEHVDKELHEMLRDAELEYPSR